MEDLQFEWDPAKARENLRKHDISFEDARTVFADERGIVIADPDHSWAEDRFVIIGISASVRLLVVVYCYRESDMIIRLISARRATPTERAQYDAQKR